MKDSNNKKDYKNCWEFFNCVASCRDKCPAYIHKSGNECWFVAGTYSGRPGCCMLADKIKSCLDCEWYQQFND